MALTLTVNKNPLNSAYTFETIRTFIHKIANRNLFIEGCLLHFLQQPMVSSHTIFA